MPIAELIGQGKVDANAPLIEERLYRAADGARYLGQAPRSTD